jgi:Domain of unknown function (DUF3819)
MDTGHQQLSLTAADEVASTSVGQSASPANSQNEAFATGPSEPRYTLNEIELQNFSTSITNLMVLSPTLVLLHPQLKPIVRGARLGRSQRENFDENDRIAIITCKDQLISAIQSNVKTAFMTILAPQQKDQIDMAASMIANVNVELVCSFIQKWAIEKAIPGIDKALMTEYEEI